MGGCEPSDLAAVGEYLAGAIVALAVTRLAMGVALFVVRIWLGRLVFRTRKRD